MQKLQNSQGVQCPSAFLSIVPGMRGAIDPVARPTAYHGNGVQQQAQGIAGRVDQVGPQRAANTRAGKGSAVHRPSEWPGRTHGVRQPVPTETPLSWQEVVHGINHGLIVCK